MTKTKGAAEWPTSDALRTNEWFGHLIGQLNRAAKTRDTKAIDTPPRAIQWKVRLGAAGTP